MQLHECLNFTILERTALSCFPNGSNSAVHKRKRLRALHPDLAERLASDPQAPPSSSSRSFVKKNRLRPFHDRSRGASRSRMSVFVSSWHRD